jgi:hypothetical protein
MFVRKSLHLESILAFKGGYFAPILLVALMAVALLAGCSAIARTAALAWSCLTVRRSGSSTAVVAADLLERTRGDQVDILDSMEVPDPTDNTKKELWYRVRAHDVDKTEGWIEAAQHHAG